MDHSIESGLLETFRSLLRIQGIILAAALGLQLLDPQGAFLAFSILYLTTTILLALLLRIKPLRKILKRAYLPIVLGAAALGPSLCFAAAVLLRLAAGYTGADASMDPGGLTLWLLPPLLLFSSQYSYKIVILFTTATAGIDVLLAGILQILGGQALQPTLEEILARVLIYLIIGYVVTRFSDAQRRSRRDLAEKNTQLINFASTREQLAVTRERNRMARELHDTLAHTLTALSVQLQAAEILVRKDPPAAAELLETLSEETREGTQEVRRAMHALRASPLEDLGLLEALANLANSAASRAGCLLELQLPNRLDDSDPVLTQHLFRAAEEALNNIVQHARATTIHLSLTTSDEFYTLRIEDDGIGFDPESIPEKHYGLQGVKERAMLCGGIAEIKSSPGKGTILTIQTGTSL